MCSNNLKFVSKTEHYLKVKKPLLERQRRARINKCLTTLKNLVAEFQDDDTILHMDKAEMLESAITFMRHHTKTRAAAAAAPSADGFRNGYINAVNEISRVMAATPGMNVSVGKAVMTHLGLEFNRILHNEIPLASTQSRTAAETTAALTIETETESRSSFTAQSPLNSPASSGYYSDGGDGDSDDSAAEPSAKVWRPW